MRNAALKPLFGKGNAVLFLVFHNEVVIAFRLGFYQNKTFYDWKTAHDPSYDYYSPGFISVGLIIQHLIKKGFVAFNFMAGNYRYKRSWTNNENALYNKELLFSKQSPLALLYLNYRLKWRDKIKELAKFLKVR